MKNVAEVVEQYGDYIAGQLLADSITVDSTAADSDVVILDIDDIKLGAVVTKI